MPEHSAEYYRGAVAGLKALGRPDGTWVAMDHYRALLAQAEAREAEEQANKPPKMDLAEAREFAESLVGGKHLTLAEMALRAIYNAYLLQKQLIAKRDVEKTDAAAVIAQCRAALLDVTPPFIADSVPDSWEIYTAFVSGGSLHRYTVQQAKLAQSALSAIAAWEASNGHE